MKKLLLLALTLWMTTTSAVRAEDQINIELSIISLTGSFELPIDVEWGIHYLSKAKQEGSISKECTVTENKASYFQKHCGSFYFSAIQNKSLFLVTEQKTEMILVQPFSKTDGYGIGGNSNEFKECVNQLFGQPMGSTCNMDISDEGVRYTLSLIKTN